MGNEATATAASPSPRAPRRRRWPWVVLALLVLVVLLLVVFDWNLLRGPVERRVEAATGRATHIGALDVALGWPPRVVLEDLRLANADWSKHDTMVRVARAEVAVELLPLLLGRVVLPELRLQQPSVLLQRTQEGTANWDFRPAAETAPDDDRERSFAVGAVRIAQGELRVLDPAHETDLRLQLDSADAADGGRLPLRVRGHGSYRGFDFEVRGRIDSPLELHHAQAPARRPAAPAMAADKRAEAGTAGELAQGGGDAARDRQSLPAAGTPAAPGDYRVALEARAGSTRATVRARLQPPLDPAHFSVQFALEGEDLALLHPLLRVTLPATPPYSLDGTLSRSGAIWRYRDFNGTVGDSDLSGNVQVDTGGERPRLEGQLTSRRLDFDDLGASIGAAPGTGPEETASERQRQLAAERARSGKALPTRAFDLARLRAMDADVQLDAADIIAPRLPVSAMRVRITLEDGVLTLDPLRFAVAGGRMAGSVRLDASADPIRARAELQARALELPRLFPDSEMVQDSMGTIAGDLQLQGSGNSVAAMLGASSGRLDLAMGRGRISNLLLEMAGLDIAEVLQFLLSEDQTVQIHCAYAQFAVEDGLMRTDTLALDTTDTVIFGEGSIDLGRELLDLQLTPRPKDSSIAALRVPLQVSGTLRDPDIAPEGGPLALRALAGAALYALAPPAALLALVETGPGRTTTCDPAVDNRSAQEESGD